MRGLLWVITLGSLVFSSGCSLVISELAKNREAQGGQKRAENPDSGSRKESEKTDEDLEAQPPVNGEGGQDSGGLSEGKELVVSDLTVKTDDQDWQKADQENLSKNGVDIELTLLTPEGRSAETSDELVIVSYYQGIQGQVSTRQFAQRMMEDGFLKEYEAKDWNILAEKRNDILAEVEMTGGHGYARFLSTEDGIYSLYYLADSTPQNNDVKIDWRHRMQQSGKEDGLTL
ncbi:hypothetical protein ACFOUO_05340 [Salinithrix halophila]|uniref:Uncharacterized protein n=1 Tax=Salinithrix halophila TaxID=1485204 RepID=A0ABV8JBG1_9BACL